MRKGIAILIFLLLSLGVGSIFTAYADCAPGNIGGPGNQVIICWGLGDFVAGDGSAIGGDDIIHNDSILTIGIIGDGGEGLSDLTDLEDIDTFDEFLALFAEVGGDDIIINDYIAPLIIGDLAFVGGDDEIINSVYAVYIIGDVSAIGGDDGFTNFGEAEAIIGDLALVGGDDVVDNFGDVYYILGDVALLGGQDELNNDGYAEAVIGDVALIGRSDTINNSGFALFLIGDLALIGANDRITNNGMTDYIIGDASVTSVDDELIEEFFGDGIDILDGAIIAFGEGEDLEEFAAFLGGDDRIINNGIVFGDIIGDLVIIGGGDDIIINNGLVVGDINGDIVLVDEYESGYGDAELPAGLDEANVATEEGDASRLPGGGDDRIINNGTVRGNINGNGGDDTIVVNGRVSGDVNGGTGNDEVILHNDADVKGLLNGGPDYDTLHFAQEVDEVEYVRIAQIFDDLDPARDSLTVNGREFDWVQFERLINWLTYQTCASQDGRVNDSSNRDCAAPVAIYSGSIVVYGIDPATGDGAYVLTVGDEQIAAVGVPEVNTLLAEGVNPYTGQPIAVYRLTTGEYQLNTYYHDGKPYIVVWDDNGNFYHLAA